MSDIGAHLAVSLELEFQKLVPKLPLVPNIVAAIKVSGSHYEG